MPIRKGWAAYDAARRWTPLAALLDVLYHASKALPALLIWGYLGLRLTRPVVEVWMRVVLGITLRLLPLRPAGGGAGRLHLRPDGLACGGAACGRGDAVVGRRARRPGRAIALR